MTWMAPSSLMLRRKERENDVALSHSPQTDLVLSFTPPSFVVLFAFLSFCSLTGDVEMPSSRRPH